MLLHSLINTKTQTTKEVSSPPNPISISFKAKKELGILAICLKLTI